MYEVSVAPFEIMLGFKKLVGKTFPQGSAKCTHALTKHGNIRCFLEG
jgi:hypothetical protein